MDERDIESIRSDAIAIEALCVAADGGGRELLQVARDACRRIQECCERSAKRIKRCSPSPHEESADQDEREKHQLVERSRKAAEFVLPFGKHKGVSLKDVPNGYMCWLMGVKREGRDFQNIPMDKHNWILANHADVMAEVQAFLTWRCWACGSTDVRFRRSRLCCDCWHDAKT